MKIKTYAEGGGLIYTPFISEQSTFGNTSSKSSESSDSEDSKLDPLDKELIALMKDRDLLPNEIEMIYNELISFQRSTQSLSSYSGLSGTDTYRSAMPGMLQIMSLLSQAKYNKGDYDEKWDEIRKHNAGSEVAMDSHGNMWVSEDGKIKRIRPNEYDRKKHYVLSNSEIMDLRRRSPELAFDNSLFTDTGMDVVGGEDVRKEIDDIINNFGSIKGSEFRKKAFKEIAADLQSGEGVFKITSEYSKADLTDFSSLLYSRLSAPARHLVDANAAIGGYKPAEYLRTIIASETDRTVEESYEASMSKAAGMETDPKKTESESFTEMPYLMQIGNMKGSRTVVSIAPRAAQINDTAILTTGAFTYGVVTDRESNPIDMMSLENAMRSGEAFAAGVPDTVVFGNKLLNKWEREAIMFDNSSNLTVVMLPYKEENGHKVPDFEKLNSFNKLQKIIKDNPGISKTELTETAKKLEINLDELNYDYDTNTITLKNTMPFISVSGYAGDSTIDLTKENTRYLEKVDEDDGKHIADFYNNMVKYGNLRPAKKSNKITGYATSGKGDFWRGNVFIPMNDAYYSMLLSGKGQMVPKSELTNYSERVAARAYEVASQQHTRDNDPNYEQNRQLGQWTM